MIHESSRRNDDQRVKKVAETRMKAHMRSKHAKLADLEIVARALEHIFLVHSYYYQRHLKLTFVLHVLQKQ